MSSATLVNSYASGMRPLTCNISTAIVHPEAAIAEASIRIFGEICCRCFAIPIERYSDLPQDCPDISRAVETKAKISAAWSDCISEWNIRDP
jgi:hypothetical protein